MGRSWFSSGVKRTQDGANCYSTDSTWSQCSSLQFTAEERRGSWEPVPDLLMHHWLQLLGLILAWTSFPLLCPNSLASAQRLLPLGHYSEPGAQRWVDLESHRLSPSAEQRFLPTVKDMQRCAPSAVRSDHQLHNTSGKHSGWKHGWVNERKG